MAPTEEEVAVSTEPISDPAPAAAADEKPAAAKDAKPKKAKAPKEPKPRKPKSAPAHPPYFEVKGQTQIYAN